MSREVKIYAPVFMFLRCNNKKLLHIKKNFFFLITK